MSVIQSIDEFALRDLLRCPLSAGQDLSPVELVVAPVLREVLRTAYSQGKVLSHREVLERLIHQNREWLRTLREDPNPDLSDTLKLPYIARYLRQLFRGYFVAQPVEAYSLQVGGCEITGEYAVLRRKKSHEHWILRLRGERHEHQPLKPRKAFWPDIVAHARIVDFARRNPGRKCVMLNWCVSRDLHWCDRVAFSVAQQAVEGAARMVEQGIKFAVPGYHCRACQQPQCCLKTERPRKQPAPVDKRSSAEKLERLLVSRPGPTMFGIPLQKEPAL